MSQYKILVVDDEPIVLDFLTQALQRLNHQPVAASTGERAIELIERDTYDLVLSDMKLPGVSGLTVLDHSNRKQPDTPFIVMTAFGTIENAVDAMQRGAFTYLTKPVDNKLLKFTIERALEKRQLVKENRTLRQQVNQEQGIEAIVGSSESMKQLTGILNVVAAKPVDVFNYRTIWYRERISGKSFTLVKPKFKECIY
ncbi:MAG: response regulator [Candidatus Electryonea clarkiae]|nr:response regulator [Candidatus Electryonea clarkiae]MDP8286032.1 response regulator [Candidatus Electryonea clarkiae]